MIVIDNRSWEFALPALSWIVGAAILLRKLEKLRDVAWEENHLLVKDEVDILIPLEEIEAVELKTLIGTHEVTLYEAHPYLGESFLFQASLGYLFRHDRVDDTVHELRQRMVQARQAFLESERQ